ncbi:hypothetical protein B7P43_G11600 [Cryptotermes secundus]|uniref:Ig-like domain-containing protein n=1 Tax=Cryptotermes secundus TaxID=105785 RepID=A0A2J7RMI7_9NEOP|nr:hypothetical protein B7P43_G11600 [Cryptotermes secundus]
MPKYGIQIYLSSRQNSRDYRLFKIRRVTKQPQPPFQWVPGALSRGFDVRGKHSEVASHWRDKEILDERGYFLTVTDPATLSLNNVDERDEGEYRCRVDFRQSPTRNSKVRLTVIIRTDFFRFEPNGIYLTDGSLSFAKQGEAKKSMKPKLEAFVAI